MITEYRPDVMPVIHSLSSTVNFFFDNLLTRWLNSVEKLVFI